MKNIKFIGLIISILLSQENYAQLVRFTENNNKLGMDVFLMPGVNPKGTRLFQFSFIKYKHGNQPLRSDSLVLHTVSGNAIILTNPTKDTSYQSTGNTKCWNSSFALSSETISVLKSEKISDLLVFVNNRQRKIDVSFSSGEELQQIITKYF